MKKLNYIIYALMLLIVVSSCKNEDSLPFEFYEDTAKGAYPRALSEEGAFFLTSPEPENSFYNFLVEFYDDNNGQNVAEYSFEVRYQNLSVTPPVISDSAPLLTITADQFGNSPTGLPTAEGGFVFDDFLNALGMTLADVNGGDRFVLDATVTLNDGRTFTSDTTDDNIEGNALWNGLFRRIFSVLCTSELAGTLNYTTNATGGWCSESGITGEAVWTGVGPGEYTVDDFSYGTYLACYGGGFYPDGTLKVVDACEKLGPTGLDQYGDSYTFNAVSVSADNTILTIDWVNTYGEAGITELTRQDGALWPNLGL